MCNANPTFLCMVFAGPISVASSTSVGGLKNVINQMIITLMNVKSKHRSQAIC